MSKSITVKDLKEALSPLVEVVASMEAQMFDFNNSMEKLIVRLDILMHEADSEVEPTPRKSTKKSTRKSTKVAKKTVKKNVSESDSDSAENTPVKKQTSKLTKKTVRKTKPAKKLSSDQNSESDSDSAENTPVKKPAKKTITRKAIKRRLKNTSKAEKKVKKPNVMEYFKLKFAEDETKDEEGNYVVAEEDKHFSQYLTKEIREETLDDLLEKHENWDDLKEETRKKHYSKALYDYMRNEHKKDLQDMKKEYLDDLEKLEKPDLVKQEDSASDYSN